MTDWLAEIKKIQQIAQEEATQQRKHAARVTRTDAGDAERHLGFARAMETVALHITCLLQEKGE